MCNTLVNYRRSFNVTQDKTVLRLPIEELIQSRQNEYYDALGMVDKEVDSAVFVELMLEIIRDSLKEINVVGHGTDQVGDQDTDQVSDQDKSPVEQLLLVLGDKTLSALELMELLGLSHRATFDIYRLRFT